VSNHNPPYFVTSRVRIVLFYAYLVAIGILSVFVAKTILDSHRISTQSHRALCALKVERTARVEQTSKILTDPTPENLSLIRTFGRPLLERSLATARADEKSLEDISC